VKEFRVPSSEMQISGSMLEVSARPTDGRAKLAEPKPETQPALERLICSASRNEFALPAMEFGTTGREGKLSSASVAGGLALCTARLDAEPGTLNLERGT
jgi:hypothetical protein